MGLLFEQLAPRVDVVALYEPIVVAFSPVGAQTPRATVASGLPWQALLDE